MSHAWRPLQVLLSAVTMFTAFSAAPASAIECGDTSGPGGTDVPCSCNDIVTTDTVFDASDPITNAVCPDGGMFVGGGVKLDARALNMRCADSHVFPTPITIGLFIVGDSVEITHGIIRGCDYGIYGATNGSTIERVTARDGRLSFYIRGNGNTLKNNLCQRSFHYGGFYVVGDENILERNYCQDHNGDAIALDGNHNTLFRNLCHNSLRGIAIGGDSNLVQENSCRDNRGDGIAVFGSLNDFRSNRGQNNGAHGIFAPGPTNMTDFHNYAPGNAVEPPCVIDNSTGRYC